jgi:hypothetical protein
MFCGTDVVEFAGAIVVVAFAVVVGCDVVVFCIDEIGVL